jgi:hypothetical protein
MRSLTCFAPECFAAPKTGKEGLFLNMPSLWLSSVKLHNDALLFQDLKEVNVMCAHQDVILSL